jgi:RNA polymerase sigma-70 factor (ECF subfamily)
VTDSPDSSQPIRDRDLLRRHLEGDSQAFEALVERYRRELFSFLSRFTGNAALAEDVFQETFLQLHLSAASFDQSRALKPWVFTIAANKARDALRSRARRRAAPLDAVVAGSDNERTSYVDLMPSEIPPPEAHLANFETRRAVQSIVQKMPESLRLVLLLSYFHELPYRDIAEVLGVPLGTVKSRLHTAVKYFAGQWEAVARRLGYDEQSTE